MTDAFDNEMKAIRSEKDFHAFIQRHASDPRVVKMLSMTKGRDSMDVAKNLAGAQKVDLSQIQQFFGFSPC